MKRNSRTLTALTVVAGVAALGVVAPSAQASYFTPPQVNGVCQGADNLHGIGASAVRGAKIAWGNRLLSPDPAAPLASGFGYDAGADFAACGVFKLPADGGTKVFDYKPSGSGSCTTITGANGAGPRQFTPTGEPTITDVAYCGTETALTAAQITAAEGGPAATPSHPSEAQLMTIPVAQVAIAADVRLPDGCRVADTSKRVITRDELESAFEGTITTWGQIFQGGDMTSTSGTPADNAACRAKAFKRVVRLDSSGSTTLFKRYLEAVDGPTWTGLGNTVWPNDSGATAVLRGDANGAGSQLEKLSAQGANGGIGYADVAVSRDQDYGWTFTTSFDPADTKMWLRVQRIVNDDFNSPAVSNAQSTSGANLGSACNNVTYSNQPSADLGASWSATTSVPTPADYSICGINYLVTSLWGFDNVTSAKVWAGSNQGEFRAMKDYMRYTLGIIRTGVGPGKLPLSGYAKLPADVAQTARCQINILGYIRAGSDPAPGSPIPRPAVCP